MSELKTRVLIVDDECLIAMALSLLIEEMGLTVCATAASADAAIAYAQRDRPSIVLMDVRLQGDKDGVDAAVVIHETVGSKVIYITASGEPATLKRIQADHPSAVLIKPITEQQLQAAIAKVRQIPGRCAFR